MPLILNERRRTRASGRGPVYCRARVQLRAQALPRADPREHGELPRAAGRAGTEAAEGLVSRRGHERGVLRAPNSRATHALSAL